MVFDSTDENKELRKNTMFFMELEKKIKEISGERDYKKDYMKINRDSDMKINLNSDDDLPLNNFTIWL